MSDQSTISQRMDKIRFVFQHAMQFSSSNDDETIDAYLKNVEPEFRAVAYEGVAMSLAQKDIHDRALMNWRAFMRRSDPVYVPHIHVGLGWAIAKQKLSSLIFLDSLRPSMMYRVLDGHGYFDGIFRQVLVINNQSRPASIEPDYYDGYDQGVGRSLWYANLGDVDQVADAVSAFAEERRPALWRGVGIAAAFVGGCDEETLDQLLINSSAYAKHLRFGAAMAIKARVVTNTVSADTIQICNQLCNMDVERASELITGLESSSEADTYPILMSRVIQIESQLAMESTTAGVHKENE